MNPLQGNFANIIGGLLGFKFVKSINKMLGLIFANKFSNNGKVNRNDLYCKKRLVSFVQMIILSNVNTKAMI